MAFRFAFSTNAYTRRSLKKAVEDIAEAGYDAVEILADKPHAWPEDFGSSDAEKLAERLGKLGLAVSNVNANCSFGYWTDAPPEPYFEPSLCSPNKRHRKDRVKLIKKTLDLAARLGAGNISITTGKALPGAPPEAANANLREGLAEVLDHAAKRNVAVGIESEPGLWIERYEELRALIDEIGSPLLGANLDIGHSWVGFEDLEKAITTLGKSIFNLHVEDIPGRKHYHLVPGDGDLDFGAVRRGLEKIGYDRFLTVELYTMVDDPETAARRSLKHLKKVFG
jgi:sugar phosphate isomerase/epimerase